MTDDPLRRAIEETSDPCETFEALLSFLELPGNERERILGELRKAVGMPLIEAVQIGPAPDHYSEKNDDGSLTHPRELCFIKVPVGISFDDPELGREVEVFQAPGRAIKLYHCFI